MSTERTAIVGGIVLKSSGLLCDTSVIIERGVIVEISTGKVVPSATIVDARDCLVLPGFVDIHSDYIEQAREPRLGGIIPDEIALRITDIVFLASGITTVAHALHTLDVPTSRRSFAAAKSILEALRSHSITDILAAQHFAILRAELSEPRSCQSVILMAQGNAGVLGIALEDHAPGFAPVSLFHFERYARTQFGMNDEDIRRYMEAKINQQPEIRRRAAALAEFCVENQKIILSLDDHSVASVQRATALGVSLCQFPTTVEAARACHTLGIKVAVGATNILRGSQSGNINASELVATGIVDIVCSDYSPYSMIHAVAHMARQIGTVKAVTMASAHAADVICLHDRGTISIGKRGDLIIVTDFPSSPMILATIVAGRVCYCSDGNRLITPH